MERHRPDTGYLVVADRVKSIVKDGEACGCRGGAEQGEREEVLDVEEVCKRACAAQSVPTLLRWADEGLWRTGDRPIEANETPNCVGNDGEP